MKYLPLLLSFCVSSVSAFPVTVTDPDVRSHTITADVLSFSNTGEATFSVPDTSMLGAGSGNTLFLNVSTFQVAACQYERIKINAAGEVTVIGANSDCLAGPDEYDWPLFDDVRPGHWAYTEIASISDVGITSGCGLSIYCPDDTVTRSQMAVFLLRAMYGGDHAPPTASGTIFSDIPSTYWAAAWIEELAASGVTGGCGGGNYCPDDTVTRSQMAIFLLRALHGADYTPTAASGTVFTDVPANYWAAAWIEELAASGVTGGCGGGNYCPEEPVTRAQMAVFLTRNFNL